MTLHDTPDPWYKQTQRDLAYCRFINYEVPDRKEVHSSRLDCPINQKKEKKISLITRYMGLYSCTVEYI